MKAAKVAPAKNQNASLVSLTIRARKPSLDKVVQLAAQQKEKIVKTLNNTQKMNHEHLNLNLTTLNLDAKSKLSTNSSALGGIHMKRTSLG